MTTSNQAGLRLEFPDDRANLMLPGEINNALAAFGAHVWQLDLKGVPSAVRALLGTPELNDAGIRQVMDYFMLPREQLIAKFAEAGRTLQVPGGGSMSTLDMTHDVQYPELYIVNPGVDYSRFDQFHVNLAEDGTGVDEMMFVLWGGGVRLLQHIPGAGLVSLYIDCPDENYAWYVTYSGAYPHIGSISGCKPGTKVLMQVIGPERWAMKYEDDE